MLIINYDPDKGQAIRDSDMNFKLRDAMMRSNLPHAQGKRAYSLHVGSLLFVMNALRLIKEKKIDPHSVRFQYLNDIVPHSRDGRFTKLKSDHPMRALEGVQFAEEEEEIELH